VPVFETSSDCVGEAVPIPSRLLASSKNSEALSCAKTPADPAKKIDPAVADVTDDPIAIPDAAAYSKAVAPALTLSTCNAVPSAVSPVPPFATVTVSESVEPAAVTVMFADPSKLTPLIFRAVCRTVAEPAFPEIVV
jgi:hypothetical protein